MKADSQTDNSPPTGTLVVGQTSQGVEIRGSVLRLTRHQIIFEMYNRAALLAMSEVLSDFKIVVENQHVYSGRAVISHVMHTGTVTICEASLEEFWIDIDFLTTTADPAGLRQQFDHFMQGWHKTYKVSAEYKVVIADMQTFLMDLRQWLDQVELGVRSSPSGSRIDLERELIKAISQPILACIDGLFGRFEKVAGEIEKDLQPAHWNYMRRQLHSLVLGSPFAYRTFSKPLGYAGDYEMVDMMNREPYEGSTLFAKVLNVWFLDQVPARAHRNRIVHLSQKILEEVLRVRPQNRPARVYNLGCGPAVEIQQFLTKNELSNAVEFTLADFNDEALQHLRDVFETMKRNRGLSPIVQLQKRSVHQILKEAARTIDLPAEKKFDLVYCAGLFDYLPDAICQRLMNIFYSWLAPGGLLLATNVDASNPIRNGMEHLLDWHLIYRNSKQVQS